MKTLLMVAAGGAIGSSLRYLVNVVTLRWLGSGFPWATFAINVTGSAAMGLLAGLLAGRSALHPFLLTGVLGGFTTFSAFSLDAVGLWSRGQGLAAVVYVTGSVALSLGGVALGLALARGIAP